MADKKVKLFTHDDLDGIGCGVLGEAAYGENISIDYCTNSDINTRFRAFVESGEYQNYDRIFITDINLDAQNAALIDSLMAKKTMLLDHHPTAMFLNDYDWAFVDTTLPGTDIKTSGTELFFKQLEAERALDWRLPYKEFAELVRDYDTWRWTTPEGKGQICKDYNDSMHLYGKANFVQIVGERLRDGSLELTETDRILLDVDRRRRDAYCDAKLQNVMVAQMGPYTCGVVFADTYVNDLAHHVMNHHPEIDFVAVVDPGGNVALRTKREDLDLGQEIAKPLGGGGHPKAAGFQFDPQKTQFLVQDIFRGEEHVHVQNQDGMDQTDSIEDGPNQGDDEGQSQVDD